MHYAYIVATLAGYALAAPAPKQFGQPLENGQPGQPGQNNQPGQYQNQHQSQHASASASHGPPSIGNFKVPLSGNSYGANRGVVDTSNIVNKVIAKLDLEIVVTDLFANPFTLTINDGNSATKTLHKVSSAAQTTKATSPNNSPSAVPAPSSSSTTSQHNNEQTAQPVTPPAPTLPASAATTAATTLATSTTPQKAGATVTATPETDESEYLSPVTIGGQPLNLDFDTGSADLWVMSTGLSSAQSEGHGVFDPSKSPTYQEDPSLSWTISYGDGSTAGGKVGFDTVVIGGATATRQAVELATVVSDSFAKDKNNDGLVGLAFSPLNVVKPKPQQTFMDNILSSLDQPVFTADLRKQGSLSTYEFGVIDQSKYSGDIHYTTIDADSSFWRFDSSSYTIGGQTYQIQGSSKAIADTGSSLILVSSAVAQAYYAQVPGSSLSQTAGGYIYPCNAQLPDFGVAIGNSGFTATIPGSAVTYSQSGNGQCFGGIQTGGQATLVFGDMLLKQYFAVFNVQERKFGLAKKA